MSVLYVRNTASSGDGSLLQVLQEAVSGDVIKFDTTAFSTESPTTIYLYEFASIARSVTIDGSDVNVVIDGQYDATVDNSGVYWASVYSDLKVIHVVFQHCYSSGMGGVIRCSADSETVEVTDCQFLDNVITGYYGSVIYMPSTTSLKMSDCLIQNNRAGKTGAVYCVANDSIDIQNTEFISNKATATASGLYIKGSTSSVTKASLKNVTVIDGTAYGATILETSDLTIENCYFSNNGTTTITDVTFSNDVITATGQNYFGEGVYGGLTSCTLVGSDSILAHKVVRNGSNVVGYNIYGEGYVSIGTATHKKLNIANGLVQCVYGANIQSATSSNRAGVLKWTATQASTKILIERKTDAGWDVVTDSAVNGSYSLSDYDPNTTYVFRLFDGYNRKTVVMMYQESSGKDGYYYFLNNADDGEGSLRQALLDADPGLVVTPTDALDVDSIIINLASELEITSNLSISGGDKRIVLTGSNVFIDSPCESFTAENVDFTSGVWSKAKDVLFTRCRFIGYTGSFLGSFANYRTDDQATIRMTNCLVCDNVGAGLYLGSYGSIVTLQGSTLYGNGTYDILAESEVGSITATNCIIGSSSINEGITTDLATSICGASDYGFIKYGNNAETDDFHLSNASVYVDSGAADRALLEDYDRSPRRHYAEKDGTSYLASTVGAYEHYIADLYWIGKDENGYAVENPSFHSNKGWAISETAEVCDDVIPTASSELYVLTDVTFTDGINGKALTLGRGVSASIQPTESSNLQCSVVLHSGSSLTVGKNQTLDIPVFYSALDASFITDGDVTLNKATIRGTFTINEGSTFTLNDSNVDLDSFSIALGSNLVIRDSDVNIDDLTINGTLTLINCSTSGTTWQNNGVLNVQGGSYNVETTRDDTTLNASSTFDKASITANVIAGNTTIVCDETSGLSAKEISITKLDASDAVINVEDITAGDVTLNNCATAGTQLTVSKDSTITGGTLQLNAITSESEATVTCVNTALNIKAVNAKLSVTTDGSDVTIGAGTLESIQAKNCNLTLENVVITEESSSENCVLNGDTLQVGAFSSTNDQWNIDKTTSELGLTYTNTEIKATSVPSNSIIYVDDSQAIELETFEGTVVATGGSVKIVDFTDKGNSTFTNATLDGMNWTLDKTSVSECDVYVCNIKSDKEVQIKDTTFEEDCALIQGVSVVIEGTDCKVDVDTIDVLSLKLTNCETDVESVKTSLGVVLTGGSANIADISQTSLTTSNTALTGATWEFNEHALNVNGGTMQVGTLTTSATNTLTFTDVELDVDTFTAPNYDLDVQRNYQMGDVVVKTAKFTDTESSIDALTTSTLEVDNTTLRIGDLTADAIISKDSTLLGDVWRVNTSWNSTSDQINVVKIIAPSTATFSLVNTAIDPSTIEGGASITDLDLTNKTLSASSMTLNTLKSTDGTIDVKNLTVGTETTESNEIKGDVHTIENWNSIDDLIEVETIQCEYGSFVNSTIKATTAVINGDSTIDAQGNSTTIDNLTVANYSGEGNIIAGKTWNIQTLTAVGSNTEIEQLNVKDATFSNGVFNGNLDVSGSATFSDMTLEGDYIYLEDNADVTFTNCTLKYKGILERNTSQAILEIINSNVECTQELTCGKAVITLDKNTFTAESCTADTFKSNGSTVSGTNWTIGTLIDPDTTLKLETLVVKEMTCTDSDLTISSIRITDGGKLTFSGIDVDLTGMQISENSVISIRNCDRIKIETVESQKADVTFISNEVISIAQLDVVSSATLLLSSASYVGTTWTLPEGFYLETSEYQVKNTKSNPGSELILNCNVEALTFEIAGTLTTLGSSFKAESLIGSVESNIKIQATQIIDVGTFSSSGAVDITPCQAISGENWTLGDDVNLHANTTIGIDQLTLGANSNVAIGTKDAVNTIVGTNWTLGENSTLQLCYGTKAAIDSITLNKTHGELLGGSSLVSDVIKFIEGDYILEDDSYITSRQTLDGAATLTSTTQGYFATPVNYNLASFTISGVRHCDYGAKVLSLTASYDDDDEVLVEIKRGEDSDVTAKVCVEYNLDETGWKFVKETSDAEITFSVDEPDNTGYIRIFDGESFITDRFWTIASVQYKTLTQIIAPEEDSPVVVGWYDDADLDDASIQIKVNQSVTILARIYNAFSPNKTLLNKGTNITSVKYTIERYRQGLFNNKVVPIEGHVDVEAGSDCVLETIRKSEAWSMDSKGYTFVLTPNTREYSAFPEVGAYRIIITITLAKGNPITFYGLFSVSY